jgi:YegS/Rv2252/BmrU family lipid kinase
VNPLAGAGKALRELKKLRNFAQQHRWNTDFLISSSVAELAAQARDGVAVGRSRIFVLGGDGTFQVVANAIGPHSEIVLGVLPAGGGNDLAKSLGLPADAVAAAKLLLAGEICFLDAVCVRTSDGAERLYAGGGGLGLDAEASRYAGGSFRNVRGRLRYLLSAIRALANFHDLQVRIHFESEDEQIFSSAALLVGVLNTPSYGAGVRLAPEARTDDGLLDLVLLEHLGVFEVAAMLPTLLLNGEVRTKRQHHRCIKWARIETDRPCAFHGDGEIFGMTPVEIRIMPGALRVLRPRQST